MTSKADNTSARYGVDIRERAVHAEANNLNEIFEMLAIVTGRVHVTDRMDNSLVFEGTPEDVRAAILRSGNLPGGKHRVAKREPASIF